MTALFKLTKHIGYRRTKSLIGITTVVLASVVLVVTVCAMILDAYQAARLIAPPATRLVLDRNGRFLAQLEDHIPDQGGTGYGYWRVDQRVPRIEHAILALEDRRFWSHPGVDLKAIARAAWQNINHGQRREGASTLAMQIARMQRPGPRTYFKKSVESLTALFLTRKYGREAVLRHYLRIAPYGNRIHGIAYAARLYLDKPVADLDWAEIAYLSSIPRAPGRMNPFDRRGHGLITQRAFQILDALHGGGVMNKSAWRLARARLGGLAIMARPIRPPDATHAILALAEEKNVARLFHASLDVDLQHQVAQIVRSHLRRWRSRGASHAAALVIARESREILAWLGSPDYFAFPHGAIDFVRVRRPAGSTLKPFLYALALERGHITPLTVLQDRRYLSAGIHNYDQRYLGAMLPRQALANSRNVPAIAILKRLGADEGYRILGEFHLHNGERPARYYGLGMAIGTLPTTLARLVTAYAALTDDGRDLPLSWRRSPKLPPAKVVLSPDPARLVTLFLSDPQARLPSFARMGNTEYPFATAVKTGTSQGYRDAWAIVATMDYVVGVWVGRADHLGMAALGGAESAAAIAKDIMISRYPAGTQPAPFPRPSGYSLTSVCATTGERVMSDGSSCSRRVMEYLVPGSDYEQSKRGRMRLAEGRRDVKVQIIAPADGLHLLRDHAIPRARNTVGLAARTDPPIGQVLWLIDGRPYKVAHTGDTVRWQLQTGVHIIEARLPYHPHASDTVRIRVD